MEIRAVWDAVLRQDAEGMRAFFWPDARVDWPNTGERFTVAEFLRANCEYPGQWEGEVERVLSRPGEIVTVTRVWNWQKTSSHHAVSFFQVREGRIAALEEYWGDDGPAPQWRQAMHIGRRIGED